MRVSLTLTFLSNVVAVGGVTASVGHHLRFLVTTHSIICPYLLMKAYALVPVS